MSTTLRRTILGAKRDKRSLVFRAVEDVLRADEGLSAIRGDTGREILWLSFSGSGDDTMPFSADLCPVIALTFVPMPVRYEATALDGIPMGVRVECATGGTCIDDSIDLWGMVEDALLSTKATTAGPPTSPDGSPMNVQKFLAYCDRDPVNANAPAGAFDFRWSDTGIYGHRPRNPDGTFAGPIDLMIASGLLTCRVVKPA